VAPGGQDAWSLAIRGHGEPQGAGEGVMCMMAKVLLDHSNGQLECSWGSCSLPTNFVSSR
jgi:hypothetical protein